jgi:hypothetical protein
MIPTARNALTRPPTGTPRRAMHPGEGLPISLTLCSGEQPDCPSLRASNEHRFIVRVLRAQRMVWLLPFRPSEAARCASTGIVPATPPLFQHPARNAAHLSMWMRASQGEAEDTRRLRGVEPCAIQTRTRRGRGVRSASTFYNLERLWPKGVKKTARRERSIGRMSRG